MGHQNSKIDTSKMPLYFVEQPIISKLTCGLLERSLRNVVGCYAKRKNSTLQFGKLYQEFFSKLEELETEDCRLVGCIGSDLCNKSNFLVQLLNLIVSTFKIAVKTNRRRLDSKSKRKIKSFCNEYSEIKLECWGNIGEALFHAMKECDEMYAEFITDAWINGYSFFLRHFLPIAFRIQKSIDKLSTYNLSDETVLRSRSQSPAPLLDYEGVVLCVGLSANTSDCSDSSEEKPPSSSEKDFSEDTQIYSNSNRTYRKGRPLKSTRKRAHAQGQLQDIFVTGDRQREMWRHNSYGYISDIPLYFVSDPINFKKSHETKFISEEYPCNREYPQTLDPRKSVTINVLERRGSCPAIMHAN